VIRGLLARLLVAPYLAFVLFAQVGNAGAADYFGRPEAPSAAASQDVTPPLETRLRLPRPLADTLGLALRLEGELNAWLRTELDHAKAGGAWLPALTIVAASFLYGVVHAIGPGHGKVIASSYFLTRRARLGHGLAMSASGAFVQAASATILVGVPAVLFEVSARRILEQASLLEMVSYGIIALLGLWMAWTALRGGHHHAHEHEHEHEHGHEHEKDAAAPPASRGDLWHAMGTGAAIGLRPCSGAILVLLFTLANGLFAIGVIATFAMGFGVSLTVAVVSLGSLGLRHSLAKVKGSQRAAAERIGRMVSFGGALLIALFGLLQLAGIYLGLLTPFAG
jgi:ABC-type nickel/cobalt efflux system permease component RcnA